MRDVGRWPKHKSRVMLRGYSFNKVLVQCGILEGLPKHKPRIMHRGHPAGIFSVFPF